MRVSLVCVATAKYHVFVNPLLDSAERHFLLGHDRIWFVFTDHDFPPRPNTVFVPVVHRPWPLSTLFRFSDYLTVEKALLAQDYVFAIDADMLFVGDVGEEVLGDMVATIHPGYAKKPRATFPYETRHESVCCVRPTEGSIYFAGGFYGGAANLFTHSLHMMERVADHDQLNGIVPKWHCESVLNRRFIDYPPTLILPWTFMSPEERRHSESRLIALRKKHTEMRS